MPTLFFSSTHDPSTTATWGAEAASHMPNSLHLVVPAGHGVSGKPIVGIERAFLESGTVEGLDVSGRQNLKMPPLEIPEGTETAQGASGER